MRLMFLGAGGVGGYFGGRMAESGADITFLVRPSRAAKLADGLTIESPRGNSRVSVQLLVPGEAAAPFDVIVLTCKAYDLIGALESVAPHINEGTVILPLLNGFDHLGTIEARFPEAIVWGGVAGIVAMLTPEGNVRQMHPNQFLTIGQRGTAEVDGPDPDTFAAMARAAEITARVSDEIEQEMWDKWIFLATLAAATCLMRGPVGAILAADDGEAQMSALLDECLQTGAAEGHSFSDTPAQDYKALLFQKGAPTTASMLRDILAGGPTEADHIVGAMIRRAERRGLATPLLRIAHMHLQVYEATRAA